MLPQTDVGPSNGVASEKQGKSERIPSHDFHAWDKYDAEKEADKVNKEKEKKSSSSPIMSPKGIPADLSETGKLSPSLPTWSAFSLTLPLYCI